MKQSIAALPILLRLFVAVTFVELLNTTAGSDITLTSGKERMALGADINTQILLRRPRLKRIAAATRYRSLEVFRMDSFFHLYTPLFSPDWE